MKNEIKEITEIITILQDCGLKRISRTEGVIVNNEDIATALHNAGYRKQSETVNEFAEKVKFMLSDSDERAVAGAKKYGKNTLVGMNYAGEAFGINKAIWAIDFVEKQLAEQYGKEE